jgi:microcystin-dependent protein
MVEPFLGEIRRVSFAFAPRGWAMCNGQVLSIAQNQALFSLLGTYYGGNGVTTFALPDLRGRVAFSTGAGMTIGASGGEEAHTLTVAELPAHIHAPMGSSATGSTSDPTGETWASTPQPAYASGGSTPLHPSAISPAGGGQPHNNMPPYLVINHIIALQGIYPSRN